jgi:hypothetical protein
LFHKGCKEKLTSQKTIKTGWVEEIVVENPHFLNQYSIMKEHYVSEHDHWFVNVVVGRPKKGNYLCVVVGASDIRAGQSTLNEIDPLYKSSLEYFEMDECQLRGLEQSLKEQILTRK